LPHNFEARESHVFESNKNEDWVLDTCIDENEKKRNKIQTLSRCGRMDLARKETTRIAEMLQLQKEYSAQCRIYFSAHFRTTSFRSNPDRKSRHVPNDDPES
jgi:hypothetical protein